MSSAQCSLVQNEFHTIMQVVTDSKPNSIGVVSLQLFCNVTNTAAVKDEALSGSLPAALIRPQMVGGASCVFAAALSAVTAHHRASLRTRSLSTEVLFNLAPHSKIALALQQFGVRDDDTSLLALTVDWLEGGKGGLRDQEEEILTPAADQVRATVQGDPTELFKLDALRDTAAVTNLYKLTQEELKLGGVGEACLSRMACRGFL